MKSIEKWKEKLNCARCKKNGSEHVLLAPEDCINEWLCIDCYDLYYIKLKQFNDNFINRDPETA